MCVTSDRKKFITVHLYHGASPHIKYISMETTVFLSNKNPHILHCLTDNYPRYSPIDFNELQFSRIAL